MHDTWVEGRDFRIYDTKKPQKFQEASTSILDTKKYITKYSNYLCTACNTAAEKLLKVDCEEIKEKEQDENYYQQTPIDNELEMMVDNLLNKLSNSRIPPLVGSPPNTQKIHLSPRCPPLF